MKIRILKTEVFFYPTLYTTSFHSTFNSSHPYKPTLSHLSLLSIHAAFTCIQNPVARHATEIQCLKKSARKSGKLKDERIINCRGKYYMRKRSNVIHNVA